MRLLVSAASACTGACLELQHDCLATIELAYRDRTVWPNFTSGCGSQTGSSKGLYYEIDWLNPTGQRDFEAKGRVSCQIFEVDESRGGKTGVAAASSPLLLALVFGSETFG